MREENIPRGALLVNKYYNTLDMENQPPNILKEKEDSTKADPWFYTNIGFWSAKLNNESDTEIYNYQEIKAYNYGKRNKNLGINKSILSAEEYRAAKIEYIEHKQSNASNKNEYRLPNMKGILKPILKPSRIQNLSEISERGKESSESDKMTFKSLNTHKSVNSAQDSLIKLRKNYGKKKHEEDNDSMNSISDKENFNVNSAIKFNDLNSPSKQ